MILVNLTVGPDPKGFPLWFLSGLDGPGSRCWMEVLQQRQTAQPPNLRQQHQATDTLPLHNMCLSQAAALQEVVETTLRKDHTHKKTQASRSCDNTVVSPAGTVHLPTTGPLWTVSFMSSRWAVALQPGTKPRRYSRRCVCSSLNPGMAFPLKRAVIFSCSHSSKSTTRAATIHPPPILIHTAAAERFWAALLGPRCRVTGSGSRAGPEEYSPAFKGDVAAGWGSAPPLPHSPPSSM